MPVQFPTLSSAERDERSIQLAKNTLFPYSYPARFEMTPSVFNQTAGASIFIYTSLAFQAPHNLAISIFEFQWSLFTEGAVGDANSDIVFELSYSPVLYSSANIGTAPAEPLDPIDTGNIIYRQYYDLFIPKTATQVSTLFTGKDFHRFEPYNYLLKYNQILYLHIGIDTNLVSPIGQAIVVNPIYHTLETGAKT